MKINDICIQMLPAGSGDCIYIEFTNANFRMLIDGGYVKNLSRFFKELSNKIEKRWKTFKFGYCHPCRMMTILMALKHC